MNGYNTNGKPFVRHIYLLFDSDKRAYKIEHISEMGFAKIDDLITIHPATKSSIKYDVLGNIKTEHLSKLTPIKKGVKLFIADLLKTYKTPHFLIVFISDNNRMIIIDFFDKCNLDLNEQMHLVRDHYKKYRVYFKGIKTNFNNYENLKNQISLTLNQY